LRIALITEYPEIGGGESNLLNLAEELNKSIDVTLFCSGKVKHEAKKRNIETVEFTTNKRWIKFIPLISLNSKLKEQFSEFDIIHAYSVSILPLLININSKIIWTTHGYWEKPNGIKGKIINKIVEKVICVSQDVSKISNFSSLKKETIFLGTNFEIKSIVNNKKFNKNNINLVCIGRFQKIKGQNLLIEALRKLSQQYADINFNLSIVGDVNGKDSADID